MTSLHLIIAVAVVLTAIGVTAYLLHNKITAEAEKIATQVRRTLILVTENTVDEADKLKAHAREMADQVASVVMTPILHVKDDIAGMKTSSAHMYTSTRGHITAETAKAGTLAAQAVHEAIGVVRGVKHETCQLCGKVANIWKIVEGKIECADCSIRKLVS